MSLVEGSDVLTATYAAKQNTQDDSEGTSRKRARRGPGNDADCRGPWIDSNCSCNAILSDKRSLISTNSNDKMRRTSWAGIGWSAGDRIIPIDSADVKGMATAD